MFIKLMSFVCVFTLVLASNSYGLVIGNWEDSMDGWVVLYDGAGIELNYSTTGNTLNDKALKLYDPSAGWYNPAVQLQLQNHDLLDWFWSNEIDKFEIDVTRLSDENIRDQGWWETHHDVMFVLNTWCVNNTTGDEDGYGAGKEVQGGFWWPSPQMNGDPPPTGDDSMRVVFDLTEAREYTQMLVDAGYTIVATEVQLFLCNGGYSEATYHFDNAQLTPEPATIALLGLGGLALLRRKRAH